MLVSLVGVLVALVHREAQNGVRQNGTPWSVDEAWTAVVSQAFNQNPTRVALSRAQFDELNNPENFGVRMECSGTLRKDGNMNVLECSRYELLAPTGV